MPLTEFGSHSATNGCFSKQRGPVFAPRIAVGGGHSAHFGPYAGTMPALMQYASRLML